MMTDVEVDVSNLASCETVIVYVLRMTVNYEPFDGLMYAGLLVLPSLVMCTRVSLTCSLSN
jgi:hypothetical protein